MSIMLQTNIFEIFANVNGGSFVSIDTVTKVKLLGGKKNPMQGRVTKVMTGASVMVFQNKKSNAYENMVKRRLEAQGVEAGAFVLGPRTWGRRVPDTPIIVHEKDEQVYHYLEVIFLKAGKSVYHLDGQLIAKADIEGLVETEPSDESQGGLNNKVIIRTFSVDSLTEVRIDGLAYR
jgi:hypothetical protein